MTRHILFVTGTRADFGKLEPLALAAREAGFAVTFFVTGMHMLDRYGLTKMEVHRTPGCGVHEFLNQRPGDPQDMVLAKTVIGFSDYITEHRPDLVVVHRQAPLPGRHAPPITFAAPISRAARCPAPLTRFSAIAIPSWP
ncbi:MAG: hypothetical protein U1D35_08565, partial [Paracoccaceae bacterium]|nr:hypothetical protein [Paracoccaceae bacterium]